MSEVRDMLPCYVIVTAASVCVAGGILVFAHEVYAAVTVVTGVIAGTAVSVLNMLGIGYAARVTVRQQTQKKGQFVGNLGYGIRYAGIAAVFAALLMFRAVNLFALFLPMFVPKIYYTFVYAYKTIKKRSEVE